MQIYCFFLRYARKIGVFCLEVTLEKEKRKRKEAKKYIVRRVREEKMPQARHGGRSDRIDEGVGEFIIVKEGIKLPRPKGRISLSVRGNMVGGLVPGMLNNLGYFVDFTGVLQVLYISLDRRLTVG